MIILGGGEFANLIREYDSYYQLAYTIDEAEKISDNGFTPIFIVSEFLKNEDPFECSWDVTSDSIAAYVAHSLNAKLLIVTNVNGIYTREPNEEGSEFINVIDAKKLLTFDETSIDLMLPSLLLKFGSDCFVVNGKYPERVLSLIDDNIDNYNFDYTQIIGD